MTIQHNKQPSMPVINPNAAGIDIGSRFHVVAVRSDKTGRAYKDLSKLYHGSA